MRQGTNTTKEKMMTTTIYNFAWQLTEDVDPDVQDAYPEGDLDTALELSSTYNCSINLTNEAGFALGWVHADGHYKLA